MSDARYCPCGCKLERKKYESPANFERRQHCDLKCRTRYYKPKPPEHAFGLAVPQDKNTRRTGNGMLAFLYGKPA